MFKLLDPCAGMLKPISRYLDGQVGPFMNWWVRVHTSKCPRCGATYQALLALRKGMQKIGQESKAVNLIGQDRWDEIEKACSSQKDSG